MFAASVEIKSSAAGGAKDEDEKANANSHANAASHLSPVHGAPQASTGSLEAKCLLVQSIGAFHQQFQFFSSLQNPFDILHHDSLHVIDLALDSPDIVDRSVCFFRIEEIHSFLDDSRELLVVGKGDCVERFLSAVLHHEVVFHVVQKGVGDAVLIKLVGHAKEADSILHHVMEKIIVILIGLASVLLRNFRKKNSCHGREVSGGCLGSVFRENGLLPGDEGVHNGHVVSWFRFAWEGG